MISEYDLIVPVEIKADNDKEENQLLKQFKNELYNLYGGNEITRITEIQRA